VLWIVGVADYEDQFGGLHQAGYGRKLANRETLQFDVATSEWNYDRPMHPQIVSNYEREKRTRGADLGLGSTGMGIELDERS
jgi:hypothetical protein